MKWRIKKELANLYDRVRFRWQGPVFDKYRGYTMVGRRDYCANIDLVVTMTADLPMSKLSVVECGTWRGGMTFGMLDVVPECREFHMFDSFEGLPVPTERDGKEVQEIFEKKGFVAERNYADYDEVVDALTKFGHSDRVTVHRGWFKDTVASSAINGNIGVLRLDGDWYDSTILVLERLFDRVVPGGVIIIDDYYSWPGCSQAVHQFLADRRAAEVLRVWKDSVPYIVKLPDPGN